MMLCCNGFMAAMSLCSPEQWGWKRKLRYVEVALPFSSILILAFHCDIVRNSTSKRIYVHPEAISGLRFLKAQHILKRRLLRQTS